VTVVQPPVEDAGGPYGKLLVVTLLPSFDARRYLETETVRALGERGIDAVPSTSMMDTRTPVVAQTFIDMVNRIDADAVLLTQLNSYEVGFKKKDARPEATYDYAPTYYFNVFEVELNEYVEPPIMDINHDVVLATQLISVEQRKPVWGIDSRSKFAEVSDFGFEYQVFVDEGDAIVRALSRSGLVRE